MSDVVDPLLGRLTLAPRFGWYESEPRPVRFQSSSCLQKPFKTVSEAMTIETRGRFKKVISPKGMRRTSKDLLRAAGVRDIVAMEINNHLDEGMHRHYSTVSDAEKSDAVAAVIDLAGYREAMGR